MGPAGCNLLFGRAPAVVPQVKHDVEMHNLATPRFDDEDAPGPHAGVSRHAAASPADLVSRQSMPLPVLLPARPGATAAKPRQASSRLLSSRSDG